MDLIDGFLSDNATPECRDLYMQVHELLISLGHTEHEIDIENIINVQGNMDTTAILLIIESDLLQACKKLCQKYYIVCRDDNQLKPYLDLMYFLSYLENTIESETVIYHYNEDLSAQEQLLAWLDVFFPEYNTSVGDLVLDVMSSLIENVIQSHELKADLQPTEYDIEYHKRVKRLKLYKHNRFDDLLAVQLVKSNVIKHVHTIEEIGTLYCRSVYKYDNLDESMTADNIVSLVLMSDAENTMLATCAKQLINLLYDDIKKVSDLTYRVDDILNPTGELCKTMNTL